MSAVSFSVRLVAALALSAGLAPAQCAFSSVSVQTYGQGCNPVFAGNPVSVGAQLDGAHCRLGIDVNAFPGCCNTFLMGRVLVIGNQAASQPLPVPPFAAGCTLLASPDVVLFRPAAMPGAFTINLPPVPLPPTTIYAQGAALYFTTIGLAYDFELSAGARIDLQ